MAATRVRNCSCATEQSSSSAHVLTHRLGESSKCLFNMCTNEKGVLINALNKLQHVLSPLASAVQAASSLLSRAFAPLPGISPKLQPAQSVSTHAQTNTKCHAHQGNFNGQDTSIFNGLGQANMSMLQFRTLCFQKLNEKKIKGKAWCGRKMRKIKM